MDSKSSLKHLIHWHLASVIRIISFFLFPRAIWHPSRNLALGLVLGPWRSNDKKPWTTVPCRPLLQSFRLFQVLLQVPGMGSKGSVALQDGIPTLGSQVFSKLSAPQWHPWFSGHTTSRAVTGVGQRAHNNTKNYILLSRNPRLWRAGVVGGPLTLQGATACTMNLARKAAKKGAQTTKCFANMPRQLQVQACNHICTFMDIQQLWHCRESWSCREALIHVHITTLPFNHVQSTTLGGLGKTCRGNLEDVLDATLMTWGGVGWGGVGGCINVLTTTSLILRRQDMSR